MGSIKNGGGGGFIQFKEKEYTYKDANSELADYVGFAREGAWFPTDHWEIVIFINFGVMGSGKTVFSNGICRMVIHIYGDSKGGVEYYNTNDLIYTLEFLNREENIDNRKKVILLNFDDAMGNNAKGMNSLNTMSAANKNFEEILTMVRHLLANEDKNGLPDSRVKNGLCILIFNIQSLKRLSTLIRDNATIKIYKTAYEALRKEIPKGEDFDFLCEISEESAKHVYRARSFALMSAGTKSMPIYFPYIKDDFKIPWLIDDGKKNRDLINALYKDLKGIYEDGLKKEIIMSYVDNWMDEHEIDIDPKLIKKIISKVIYNYYYHVDEEETENDNGNKGKGKLSIDEIVWFANECKVPVYKLTKFYGKSESQLFRDKEKYEKQQKMALTA